MVQTQDRKPEPRMGFVSALKLPFLLAWDCWGMTLKSWSDTLCSHIKQAANTLRGKLCQKPPLGTLLTFNLFLHHFTNKKNKNVSNSKDSKTLEKLPRKEMLQCLKRSLNKHISEMCLKLWELSRSCYFAAGETEDSCKGCQGGTWRWKSPTSPLAPLPRQELWLMCWGKSQNWQPLTSLTWKFSSTKNFAHYNNKNLRRLKAEKSSLSISHGVFKKLCRFNQVQANV